MRTKYFYSFIFLVFSFPLAISAQHVSSLPYSKVNNSLTTTATQSLRQYWSNDSIAFIIMDAIPTSTGEIMACGYYVNTITNPNRSEGLLARINQSGKIVWQQYYYTTLENINYQFNYTRVIELRNGTFLLGGYIINDITGNLDLFLTNVNPTGSVIWNKTYNSQLWEPGNTSNSSFTLRNLKEHPTGNDIFLTGLYGPSGTSVVARLNNSGVLTWSRLYEGPADDEKGESVFGIDISNNKIHLFILQGLGSKSNIGVTTLNESNGDVLSNKYYATDNINNASVDFYFDKLDVTKMNTGDYRISGPAIDQQGANWSGTGPFIHAVQVTLDASFNFTQGYYYYNNQIIDPNQTRFIFAPDGTGVLSMHSLFGGIPSQLPVNSIAEFNQSGIIKKRKLAGIGLTGSPDKILSISGNNYLLRFLNTLEPIAPITEFLKIKPSDNDPCLGTSFTILRGSFTSYATPAPVFTVTDNFFQYVDSRVLLTRKIKFKKTTVCKPGGACNDDDDDDDDDDLPKLIVQHNTRNL